MIRIFCWQGIHCSGRPKADALRSIGSTSKCLLSILPSSRVKLISSSWNRLIGVFPLCHTEPMAWWYYSGAILAWNEPPNITEQRAIHWHKAGRLLAFYTKIQKAWDLHKVALGRRFCKIIDLSNNYDFVRGLIGSITGFWCICPKLDLPESHPPWLSSRS